MSDSRKIIDALDLIHRYGGIDGSHHKQWVLDQVVRILSNNYDNWAKVQRGKWICDELYEGWEYEWDEGIPP